MYDERRNRMVGFCTQRNGREEEYCTSTVLPSNKTVQHKRFIFRLFTFFFDCCFNDDEEDLIMWFWCWMKRVQCTYVHAKHWKWFQNHVTVIITLPHMLHVAAWHLQYWLDYLLCRGESSTYRSYSTPSDLHYQIVIVEIGRVTIYAKYLSWCSWASKYLYVW